MRIERLGRYNRHEIVFDGILRRSNLNMSRNDLRRIYNQVDAMAMNVDPNHPLTAKYNYIVRALNDAAHVLLNEGE
jgi:hypothetical protein